MAAKRVKARLIAGVLLFIALLLLGRALAASPAWEAFNRWVAGTGVAGVGIFALTYAFLTVLLVPGSILTISAGVAFGLARGFLAVFVGASLGASLSFLVSRYLARSRVESWMRSKPRFAAVDRAVGREGFKIILLTRLSPVFPFVVLNYAFGLTRVRFWPYALATSVGMLPGTLLYVYLGTLGRTGIALASGQTVDRLRTMLQIVGFVATVGVTLLVTRVARRALRDVEA